MVAHEAGAWLTAAVVAVHGSCAHPCCFPIICLGHGKLQQHLLQEGKEELLWEMIPEVVWHVWVGHCADWAGMFETSAGDAPPSSLACVGWRKGRLEAPLEVTPEVVIRVWAGHRAALKVSGSPLSKWSVMCGLEFVLLG